MSSNAPVTRDEFDAISSVARGNAQMLEVIIRLNERLTEAMERMVGLDAKLTEVQKSIVEIQDAHKSQRDEIAVLMNWHNNRKAVEGALGWLIDKGPTLGAIALIGFWVLDNWGKK